MYLDFEMKSVTDAPRTPGAYRLYRHAKVIYVGMAAEGATLRSELRRHLRGDFGPQTQSATGFDYCKADSQASAYDIYLKLFISAGLPAAPAGGRRGLRLFR
jgi:excinuclease UvrABC nuclease subunit